MLNEFFGPVVDFDFIRIKVNIYYIDAYFIMRNIIYNFTLPSTEKKNSLKLLIKSWHLCTLVKLTIEVLLITMVVTIILGLGSIENKNR